MSCLEWCKFAKDCVGEEAYDRYMKNRALGLRRRLLEALGENWGGDTQRLQQAQAVLSWSEEILKKEDADWHIVIPASILQNIDAAEISGGLRAAREILLRSGLMREDVDKICRIIEGDPSEDSTEFDVVHDAVQLARSAGKRPQAGALRTETAKRLAGRNLTRG